MFSKLKAFCDRTDGAVTVETVLWIPIYALLIGVVLDSTMLMMGQTELWNVANQTSRQVALGRMNAEEAETYAEGLGGGAKTFTVTVSSDGTTVQTTITRAFGDVSGLGVLTSLNGNLRADSFYRVEPGA